MAQNNKNEEDSKNNTFVENRTNGNYNEFITNRKCQMTRKKMEKTMIIYVGKIIRT